MAKDYARRDDNYSPAMLGVNDSNETRPVVLTSTDRIKVDSNSSDGAASTGDGTATVTTAGVRVQLSATSVSCKKVYVQAHESNTGTIVVGGATCVAALVGRRGKALYPTQGDWFYVSNLNLLYIDSTVNLDKVNYYYEA